MYIEKFDKFNIPSYASEEFEDVDWHAVMHISEDVYKAFADHRNECFESGMISNFMRELDRLYERFKHQNIGSFIFKIIVFNIHNGEPNHYDICSEALSWIAHCVPDDEFVDARSWVLTEILERSKDMRIRDAASCGINSMDDPRTLRYVREALERETSDWQREWLQRVIDELEKTKEKNSGRNGQVSNSTS